MTDDHGPSEPEVEDDDYDPMEDDDVDDEEEDEPEDGMVDCPSCRGTGMGMYGATNCGRCGGRGYFKFKGAEDDDDRIDYDRDRFQRENEKDI